MRIEVPFLGKTKSGYIKNGIDDFSSRLTRYVSLDIKQIRVKPAKGLSLKQQIGEEAKLLDASLSPGSYRIALDRTGRSISSEALSELVCSLENQGIKRVSFLIGGPLGLAENLLKGADLVLSLSQMTFTHDLARLLLLEQLYRAYTIKAGENYHK
ncbi:MAG: 23S rRNA (pseudouridine(1915)-N(3))-methyltransferase RlmH [Desulfocapsaceae bacterium]|jgi:23S rRNA (pseudouridine1915-N3)-methyltransferase|nr:23S rRNA (pseudouridine(1915)-N(3))-methyltransferase RlmH [Desulfocapsaceae bacterium]